LTTLCYLTLADIKKTFCNVLSFGNNDPGANCVSGTHQRHNPNLGTSTSDYVINGWPLRLRIGLIIQVMVSEMARCLKIKDEDDAQGNYKLSRSNTY
jgi:hypothetical protein